MYSVFFSWWNIPRYRYFFQGFVVGINVFGFIVNYLQAVIEFVKTLFSIL